MFVGDLSNNNSLIPDNGTGSGEAVAVAPLLATGSVQTAAISVRQKVSFVSQVQTDRILVPRVGGSAPTSRLLQINTTLVNPHGDGNCLFASCISKLEDLHTNNVTLDMIITMRDGLKLISSLSFVLSTGQID